MKNNNNKTYIKILVTVTFIGMVLVNVLANSLPINGQNTGQVSDAYQNLFAPAGYTFSIWGLIYLLLGMYTLYQLGLFRQEGIFSQDRVLNKIGIYFSLSSIANISWIFSWHYNRIGLSTIFMLAILFSLILIHITIYQERWTTREKLFIRLPFSVYFGWITVATIANITTWLVSIDWSGFGISEAIWTAIILIVGLAIGVLTLLRYKDFAYGLVLIWAYTGILVKHISKASFAGQYPLVIVTTVLSIAIFVLTILFMNNTSRKKQYFR